MTTATSQRKTVARKANTKLEMTQDMLSTFTAVNSSTQTGLNTTLGLKNYLMPVSYKSSLNGLTLKEKINKRFLLRVLNSKTINDLEVHYTSEGHYESLKAQLVAVYQRLQEDNILPVKYKQAEYQFGRVYPEKSLSLANIRREVRHALVAHTGQDTYVDVDIVNCHPTMLLQLADYFSKPDVLQELNKLGDSSVSLGKTPALLRSYVDHRDDKWLTPVMTTYGVSRDQAKTLFIILLYLGSFNTWAKDNAIADDVCKEIDDFSKEMRTHASFFMESVNRKWYDCMRRDYPKKEEVDVEAKRGPGRPKKQQPVVDEEKPASNNSNDVGRYLSIMLQHFEMRCLEVMYEYCVQQGLIVDDNAVLCWDGMMIERRLWDDKHIPAMEKAIYDTVGFRLKLETKGFKQGQEIIDAAKVRPPTQQELDCFEPSYMRELELYDDQKDYFERFVCVITSQNKYLQVHRNRLDDDATQKQKNKLVNHTIWHDDLGSFKNHDTKTFRVEYSSSTGKAYCVEGKAKFVSLWDLDPYRREYSTVDFMPLCRTEAEMTEKRLRSSQGTVMNLFLGYNSVLDTAKLRYRPDGTVDEDWVLQVTEVWRDVVLNLCEGKPEVYKFYVEMLSQHILEPAEKPGISCTMISLQGEGKNAHLLPIKNMVGSRYFMETSKPTDLFGEHATAFDSKLFVVVSEMEAKNATQDWEGRLKDATTADEIRLNPKNIRPYDVTLCAMIYILSNKRNAQKIDNVSGARREFAVIGTGKYAKVNNKKDDDPYGDAFWDHTATLWNNPRHTVALYYYLTRMVEGRKMSRRIPQTNGIKALMMNSQTTLQYWLTLYLQERVENVKFNREHLAKTYEEAKAALEAPVVLEEYDTCDEVVIERRKKAFDKARAEYFGCTTFNDKMNVLFKEYQTWMIEECKDRTPMTPLKFKNELVALEVGINEGSITRTSDNSNRVQFDYMEVHTTLLNKLGMSRFIGDETVEPAKRPREENTVVQQLKKRMTELLDD